MRAVILTLRHQWERAEKIPVVPVLENRASPAGVYINLTYNHPKQN